MRITKAAFLGGREVVEAEHVAYWCGICQYPIPGPQKCEDEADIQACWDGSMAVGARWHLAHECPFAHQGQPCRCNDYPNIEAVFEALGLVYQGER